MIMQITHSDEEYINCYRTLSKNSNNKQETIAFIKSKILSRLINNNIFCDVGAGDGFITQKISSYFKRTIVVEPNINYAELYKSKYFMHCMNFNSITNLFHIIIILEWTNVNNTDNRDIFLVGEKTTEPMDRILKWKV